MKWTAERRNGRQPEGHLDHGLPYLVFCPVCDAPPGSACFTDAVNMRQWPHVGRGDKALEFEQKKALEAINAEAHG